MLRTTIAPLLLLASFAACDSGDERPNVLLVTFDTTRLDHLSCYGYARKTTPRLDELADEALRFENAYAVTSWTLPSHGSIFTGKLPTSHGAHNDPNGALNLIQEGGIQGPKAWGQYRANPLAVGEVTLASVLGAGGYATHAIVGGPWMKKVFGLGRGFDSYDDRNFQRDREGSELNGRSAEDITDNAIAFVDEHAEVPFFLFLNYYDPHAPHTPEPSYLRKYWDGPTPRTRSIPFLIALYDAEIEYTDEHFGRLLEHLRSTGLYEKTLIVMTSDHGELFGDLGGLMGHGNALSQPEIHIPLIIKHAGENPPRGLNSSFVSQIDLMPTILTTVGLALPSGMQGHPIGSIEHPLVAEVYPLPFMNRQKKDWRQKGDWQVLVEGHYKFVRGSRDRHQLYDLAADPGELRNLAESDPETSDRMRRQLENYLAALPAPPELGEVEQASAEALRDLRDMGYLGEEEN